jgi:hypothetical protein
MQLSFTKVNGNKRIVVACKESSISAFPQDGTDYTGNAAFGSGTNLGSDNFVVYNGTGNSVTVSNLMPNTTYYFRIFDYNNNATTGNNSLYLLCNSTEASQKTQTSLPMQLGYFNLSKVGKQSVLLQWQTLTEQNTSYFEIQRSTDGEHFTAIGKVAAKGESTVAQTYSFTDLSAIANLNYYRIKEIDKDNSAMYSVIRNIRFIQTIFTVYPTITKDKVNIQVAGSVPGKYEISVVNTMGKILLYKTSTDISTSLNLSSFAAGTYIIKITGSDGVLVQKIVKE